MGRVLLAIGAVLGCVGVAAGTFGAHAIRQRVHARSFDGPELGVVADRIRPDGVGVAWEPVRSRLVDGALGVIGTALVLWGLSVDNGAARFLGAFLAIAASVVFALLRDELAERPEIGEGRSWRQSARMG